MKELFLSVLVLAGLSVFATEKLKSENVKKLVAQAVYEYAETWEVKGLGGIWIVSYFDHDDGTGYMVKGRPQDYYFTVTSQSKDMMAVDVEFPCGSEYDESEMPGQCDVVLKKNRQNKWQAGIMSCTCSSME